MAGEKKNFWTDLGINVGDIAYFDQYEAGANVALDEVIGTLAAQYRDGELPPTGAIGIAVLGECGIDPQQDNPVVPYLIAGIYAIVRLAKLKVDGDNPMEGFEL